MKRPRMTGAPRTTSLAGFKAWRHLPSCCDNGRVLCLELLRLAAPRSALRSTRHRKSYRFRGRRPLGLVTVLTPPFFFFFALVLRNRQVICLRGRCEPRDAGLRNRRSNDDIHAPSTRNDLEKVKSERWNIKVLKYSKNC